MLNEDYRELLQNFLKNDVRFLIIGAYALAAYGYPRSTGDIDIWVEPSQENSAKVYKSLTEFGAALSEIDEDTFGESGIVFQIGVAPRRIDIITQIDGVDFLNAYKNKILIEYDGLSLPFISKSDLIKNKKSTGRKKDILDADSLLGEDI